MEFILSRGFTLPTEKDKMENSDWFNMWKRKQFPYNELLVGDTLYWFDTSLQHLVWKTEISSVERYPYEDKREIFNRFKDTGHIGVGYSKYYDNSPDSGYLVSYKIKVLERIKIPKPANYRFPHLGWERVNTLIANKWFNRNQIDDTNILDDCITKTNSSIDEQLVEREIKKCKMFLLKGLKNLFH